VKQPAASSWQLRDRSLLKRSAGFEICENRAAAYQAQGLLQGRDPACQSWSAQAGGKRLREESEVGFGLSFQPLLVRLKRTRPASCSAPIYAGHFAHICRLRSKRRRQVRRTGLIELRSALRNSKPIASSWPAMPFRAKGQLTAAQVGLGRHRLILTARHASRD